MTVDTPRGCRGLPSLHLPPGPHLQAASGTPGMEREGRKVPTGQNRRTSWEQQLSRQGGQAGARAYVARVCPNPREPRGRRTEEASGERRGPRG